jgi:hypothetical protein
VEICRLNGSGHSITPVANERLLGIIKIITTGVVVTLIPAILTHLIQKQELEIQTLKGEMEYLKQFSDKVVERDDLIKRRNFVQYLATVAHSKESRGRWESYFDIIDKAAKEKEKLDKELVKKNAAAKIEEKNVVALERKIEAALTKKSKDLSLFKEQLKIAQDNLRSLDNDILQKSVELEVLIKNSKLSVREEISEEEIPLLVSGMNSKERSVRLISIKKLIDKYRANPIAIDLALNSLSPPLLGNLSSSGRINVLVFLRNTAQSAWMTDLMNKGKKAIQVIRQRHDDNIDRIGPQTKDALYKFEMFLSEIEN